MKRSFFASLLALLLSAGLPVSAQTFTNPLPPRAADCYVAKFGDWYYMVGTPCPGNWELRWTGIWKSRDMVHWSGPMLAYEGDDRDRPMWASEIYHHAGAYFMITTCNTWNAGSTMMLQKAPTPTGPYTLYAHLPKFGLDPGIFTDVDGKAYLLHSSWVTPLDSTWTKVTGENRGVSDNTEGQFIIKNGNRYLRFFARIVPGYPMEYEVASEPYTAAYEQKGIVYSGVFDPGHGCIAPSPDGTQLWFVSHYNTSGWPSRRLAMDPVRFGLDGMPEPVVRDTLPQPVPSLHRIGADIAPGKFVNSAGTLSGNDPLKVIDGDPATAWRTEEYLEIDLAGEFEVEKVALDFPDRKKHAWRVLSSVDRCTWKPGHEGFSRFLRIVDCDAPSVSEIHVYPVKRPVPVWSDRVRVADTTSFRLSRGSLQEMPLEVPVAGTYDFVCRLRALRGLHNAWSLYDGDRRLAWETVATTGLEDHVTQVITFGLPLTAGRHAFRLVGEEGEVEIVGTELILLEEPARPTR